MTNTKDKYAELREAHRIFNELPIYKQIGYSQCPIWHKYSSLLLADLDAANQLLQKVVDDTEIGCVPRSHLKRIEAYLPNPPTDKGEPNE